MKRNLKIVPKIPKWKLSLMDSPVLSAKPNEEGNFPSYLDGIFPPGREAIIPSGKFYGMYDSGEDSVLKPIVVAGKSYNPKAFAVDSSSMMAYNFFYWVSSDRPLHFSDGKTYDKVYFEVKLPVLKPNSRMILPKTLVKIPVVLLSDDCHSMLCFESKISEYTEHGAAKFAEAYIKRDSYYNNHFEDGFIEYIKNYQNVDHAYNEGIVQIVKHLIAITNLHQSNFAMTDMLALNDFIEPDVARKMQEAPLNIKFANILYILGAEPGVVPSSQTMSYLKLLAQFRATACFDDMIWQYFVLPNYAYNYNDMFAIMRSQMPDGLADYLEARYPHLRSWNDEPYPIHRL